MSYYVYVLESEIDNSYYIGYTQGLEKRIKDHNEGGGRYTAKKRPWRLIHSESFDSKSKAIKRERQMKKWKSNIYLSQIIFKNTER